MQINQRQYIFADQMDVTCTCINNGFQYLKRDMVLTNWMSWIHQHWDEAPVFLPCQTGAHSVFQIAPNFDQLFRASLEVKEQWSELIWSRHRLHIHMLRITSRDQSYVIDWAVQAPIDKNHPLCWSKRFPIFFSSMSAPSSNIRASTAKNILQSDVGSLFPKNVFQVNVISICIRTAGEDLHSPSSLMNSKGPMDNCCCRMYNRWPMLSELVCDSAL